MYVWISEKSDKIQVLYFSPEVPQTSVKSDSLDANSIICAILIFMPKKCLKPIFWFIY